MFNEDRNHALEACLEVMARAHECLVDAHADPDIPETPEGEAWRDRTVSLQNVMAATASSLALYIRDCCHHDLPSGEQYMDQWEATGSRRGRKPR